MSDLTERLIAHPLDEDKLMAADEIEHCYEVIDRVARLRLELEVENKRLKARVDELIRQMDYLRSKSREVVMSADVFLTQKAIANSEGENNE